MSSIIVRWPAVHSGGGTKVVVSEGASNDTVMWLVDVDDGTAAEVIL